jgi:ABC-type glycerol-3-phosphate transport system substrate-binding protein
MNATGNPPAWERTQWGLSLLIAVIVVAGTIYVLSTLGEEEKRLTIAVKQGVESVALKEIAQRFSRDRHIPVEVVELPYDELYEAEQSQLENRPARAHDSVPPFDVLMVDDPWVYALVTDPGQPDGRRLENLSALLAGKQEDFFPSTLLIGQFGPLCDPKESCSNYYAIPYVANSQLFAYRAAHFEKSGKPTTWQQVSTAAKAAEQRGGIGYVTRIGPGNSIVTDFMPILWAYDSSSFLERPGSGPPLHRPEAAFDALTSLVGTRKNLGSASFDDFDVSAYLQEGRGSMGIVWSAWAMMLVDIDDNTARELSRRSTSRITMSDRLEKLTAALLSRPRDVAVKENLKGASAESSFKEKLIFGNVPLGPEPKSRPELGVWLLAIPSNSDQKDRALEFIKYATDLGDDPGADTREQSYAAAQIGTPPPRMSVLNRLAIEDSRFKKHPSLIPAISWSLKNARARPRTACWKEIESRLGKYLEKLIDKAAKSKEVADQARQEFEPLFEKDGCRKFLQPSDAQLTGESVRGSRESASVADEALSCMHANESRPNFPRRAK